MDEKAKVLGTVFFTLLFAEIVLVVAKLAGSLGHNRPFAFVLAVFSTALMTSGVTVATRTSGFARFVFLLLSVIATGFALYLFAQASGFIAIK